MSAIEAVHHDVTRAAIENNIRQSDKELMVSFFCIFPIVVLFLLKNIFYRGFLKTPAA